MFTKARDALRAWQQAKPRHAYYLTSIPVALLGAGLLYWVWRWLQSAGQAKLDPLTSFCLAAALGMVATTAHTTAKHQAIAPAFPLVTVLLAMWGRGLQIPTTGGLLLDWPTVVALFQLYVVTGVATHLFLKTQDTAAKLDEGQAAFSEKVTILEGLWEGDDSPQRQCRRAADINETAAAALNTTEGLARPTIQVLRTGFAEMMTAWGTAIRATSGADPLVERFWQVFAQTYFEEEVKDIGGRARSSGEVWQAHDNAGPACIATNESFYLSILARSVDAFATGIQADGTQIVVRGVTVAAPVLWYNWPVSTRWYIDAAWPPVGYVLPAMEAYRQTVEELVRKKACIYERLVLCVDDEELALRYGIPTKAALQKQTGLCLVGRMDGDGGQRLDTYDAKAYRDTARVLGATVPAPVDEQTHYLIVDRGQMPGNLQEDFPLPSTGVATKRINQTLYYFDNLLVEFSKRLHTEPSGARYTSITRDTIARYKQKYGEADLDVTLFGRRNSGTTEWFAAFTTTLRPGTDTMLLQVVTDAKVAKWLGDTMWGRRYESANRWYEESSNGSANRQTTAGP